MGWIIIGGILVLVGLASSGSASAHEAEPVNQSESERYRSLRRRADQGRNWDVDFYNALIRIGFDPANASTVAQALARWAGIESSGKATKDETSAGFSERGLLQATKEVFFEGGGTPTEWNLILGSTTSRATQADLMIKYFNGVMLRVAKLLRANPIKVSDWKNSPLLNDFVWMAYTYHALPIVLKEMIEQGLLGTSRFELSNAWRSGAYHPSARAVRKGRPPTPEGLYKRFGIAANVVADG